MWRRSELLLSSFSSHPLPAFLHPFCRLLRLLDERWDYFGPAFSAAVAPEASGTGGATPPASCSSSFALRMRQAVWPSEHGVLLPAAALFARRPATTALLGDLVDYLAPDLPHSPLAERLGIVTAPTPTAVLQLLRRLSRTAEAVAGGAVDGDPGQMAGLYSFLSQQLLHHGAAAAAASPAAAGAAQPLHAEGAVNAADLAAAFAAEPLLWLADTQAHGEPQPQPRVGAKRTRTGSGVAQPSEPPAQQLRGSCQPGRFWPLQRCVLSDPSGVLASLPLERRPARVLSDVYASWPGAWHLLSQQLVRQVGGGGVAYEGAASGMQQQQPLIRSEPSNMQYCRALEVLAQMRQGGADKASWAAVLRVLRVLASRHAAGRLWLHAAAEAGSGEAAAGEQQQPDEQSEDEEEAEVQAIAAALRSCHCLCAANGGHWVCLAQRPLLGDDAQLEGLLSSQPGVHLLRLPPSGPSDDDPPSSEAMAGPGPYLASAPAQLLKELGVRRLSRAAVREVQVSGMEACPEVGLLLAQLLPLVQRWLWHSWDAEHYERVSGVFCI